MIAKGKRPGTCQVASVIVCCFKDHVTFALLVGASRMRMVTDVFGERVAPAVANPHTAENHMKVRSDVAVLSSALWCYMPKPAKEQKQVTRTYPVVQKVGARRAHRAKQRSPVSPARDAIAVEVGVKVASFTS